MKKLIVLVLGAVLVAGLVYLNDRFGGVPLRLNWRVIPEAPLEVELQTPQRRRIIHTITAPGHVEPVVEVDVSSQVVGRIVKLPVREGDPVKVDDVVAKLDSAEYEARVRSAEARVEKLKAALRRCHADLEDAQREAARYRALGVKGAATTDELADAETALLRCKATSDMARHELVEAEAALESAREDLGYTVIRSPIDGVVAQVLAEEGEVVIPGTMNNPGTMFMVLCDMDRMRVRARIDEADVTLLRPGQQAWVYLTSESDRPIPGVVQRVTPRGVQEAEVATFETRILIESQGQAVRPGMTANVEIEVRQHDDAMTVPIQAVRHRKRKDLPAALQAELRRRAESDGVQSSALQSRPTVATQAAATQASATRPARRRPRRGEDPEAAYVKVVFVVQDGKARARWVETDISDETHVEITAGLTADDKVIVGPYRVLDILTDNRAVKAVAHADAEAGP